MIIELHDVDGLVGEIFNIEYDYQAEEWVKDAADREAKGTVKRMLVRDEDGVRAEWTREAFGFRLTTRSERYEGQWQAQTLYERPH